MRDGYILADHLYHQCLAKLRPFFSSRKLGIGHEPTCSEISNEVLVSETDSQLLHMFCMQYLMEKELKKTTHILNKILKTTDL